jgi:hypothetical protein
MKKGIEGEIKEGTILVCIETQATGCGIKYVKIGSIVKCAFDIEDYRSSIGVNRNERERSNDKWHHIDRTKLRLATPEEAEMYAKGIYHLEPATEAE